MMDTVKPQERIVSLIDTAEKVLEQDRNVINHWQYRKILRETLKKLEAIADKNDWRNPA